MEIFPLAAKESVSDHVCLLQLMEVNTNAREASHPTSNLHQKLIYFYYYYYYSETL